MKKKTLLYILAILLVQISKAQSSDTIFITDFGVKPYSYENSVTQIQAAIEACKQKGAKVLSFEKGRYDIWPESAMRKEYYISNTSTESECPSKIKTVGLLFENIQNLKVEGNGALLMFHGKMTTIALDHCQDIKLEELHVDFERPAGSELRYIAVNKNYVDVAVHRDTNYEIVDGKINLYGEGWRSNKNHCIEYNQETESFYYSQDWDILSNSPVQEISPNLIRFTIPADFHPKKGNTLTIRDVVRDQVGMFIHQSKNVTLNGMQMHYMHGLGIISQYSENITMNQVKCMPRSESGRLLAASADMMHFSGCKGKILIDGCYFSGAQDDGINIHGTNLKVVEKINSNTLNLRFSHGQSYGFQAYFPGDTVAFIKSATMQRGSTACVRSVKPISNYIWQVEFDQKTPEWLELNHDCVENLTCTPSVVIRNNYFTRTSTRGTLVTTPRKVVIENNIYYKTGMSAILIEGDAEGWFESGPVCDVQIRSNTFIDCAYNGGPGNAVIGINPSNSVINANNPVHKNIRIENNTFKIFDYPVLYAKSTEGLSFINNTIERTTQLKPSTSNKNLFYFNGCNNVKIQNIIYKGDILNKNIQLKNMKRKQLKYSSELTIHSKNN
jgi:hypothetical protein